ncbi:sensor histidine kinase [Belliella kenyensis]|uniref:Sensor histidine kinase n=1 Tax=Belliella kenyensis TaxID=1472724 RepID=A0ABV8EHD7_9BACT|nr:histidine kinase [Belliella kenyensis]MCH7403490.1 histidine kinase [Belliella kenyensis]MDN3602389.1 histidine kinase [Belliella kenyensis]
MISNTFKHSAAHRYKATLIILLWVFGVAYLIHLFEPGYMKALLITGVHTVYLVVGFFLLDNIFKYYSPQGRHFLVFLLFPFLVSVLVNAAAGFTLEYSLSSEDPYHAFVFKIDLIRWFFLFLVSLSYALILLLQSKLDSQIQVKEREEQIKQLAKEAELYQLRQQLQPHFLFNSLNSISSLLRKRPEEAREMIVQLSEFLRKTIRKDDRKWVTVEEELEYLQLFVGIEQVRFGYRLRTDFQVQHEAITCMVPQLLIQPMLENAIKHGLYGVLGEVAIEVLFVTDGVYLRVKVINPYDPNAGQAPGEGFGQSAIKRRLYLLFGRHDLLQVIKESNKYVVEISIPQNYDQSSNN